MKSGTTDRSFINGLDSRLWNGQVFDHQILMVGDNFMMVGYDESNFINSEVIWGHYKFI